jgi:hypothetical protein
MSGDNMSGLHVKFQPDPTVVLGIITVAMNEN